MHLLASPGLLSYSNYGMFCVVSKCESNMNATKKLFCILALRAFKQHVESCFKCLSDKEEWRKQYSGYTKHDFGEKLLSSTRCLLSSLTSVPTFFKSLLWLAWTFMWIFPVWKTFFATISSSESVLLNAWACYFYVTTLWMQHRGYLLLYRWWCHDWVWKEQPRKDSVSHKQGWREVHCMTI